jgi:hypothetical protein
MQINQPLCITSRLQAGVRLADRSEVSITYGKREGRDGRVRYAYTIDLNDGSGRTYTNDDLQSGCQGGSLQSGLGALLAFLGQTESFPEWVCEWAQDNSNEISMLECELTETPDLIVE